MPSKVYVEATIVSYLAARQSRDPIVAARRQLTHTWWREVRPSFDVNVSQLVLTEAQAGDADTAERRGAIQSPESLMMPPDVVLRRLANKTFSRQTARGDCTKLKPDAAPFAAER